MEEHERSGLTVKQQFWLDHLRNCQSSQGTIKAYAEKHRLSLASLYFWKKQLIEDGLLEEDHQRTVRFRKLEMGPRSLPIPVVGRICLPNGVMVEWSTQGEEALHTVLRAASSLP